MTHIIYKDSASHSQDWELIYQWCFFFISIYLLINFTKLSIQFFIFTDASKQSIWDESASTKSL